MAGQWLIFWCAVLGLTVIACSEAVRYYHRRPGLGHTDQHRLIEEVRRHDDDPGSAP